MSQKAKAKKKNNWTILMLTEGGRKKSEKLTKVSDVNVVYIKDDRHEKKAKPKIFHKKPHKSKLLLAKGGKRTNFKLDVKKIKDQDRKFSQLAEKVENIDKGNRVRQLNNIIITSVVF